MKKYIPHLILVITIINSLLIGFLFYKVDLINKNTDAKFEKTLEFINKNRTDLKNNSAMINDLYDKKDNLENLLNDIESYLTY